MNKRIFHFVMIKPSHYDDDGYVIQFWRSAMPSNTLATLYGLAADCRDRRILGDEVEIRLSELDETNKRVDVRKFVRRIRRDGGLGMVALVGVQSNQFPRALDLARQFRDAGIQVCIGGFHVSGCLAMLPDLTPELVEALELGVSLFAGEAENRLEGVIRDACDGQLKPVYNYMHDLPAIENVPTPILSAKAVRRTGGAQTSFDAGRGCPYLCSFCTIINVQGRKSRFRSADDVEKIVTRNLRQGVSKFFITDDNLARNQNWEPIFDRLIELKEQRGLHFSIAVQVDTACHRIPNFIEKAGRAGVRRVFIGLENINPDSLKSARKGQNRITEYRENLQMWRRQNVVTTAGYILGFPGDTPEKIVRDIEIIKRELPIDILEFFFLTPLPGSADHKKLFMDGAPMDVDLNNYDLNHVTTGHDRMSREEWQRAYRLAWQTFYSQEHVETLLKRARATGVSLGKIQGTVTWFYGSVKFEKVHPLESGFLRLKYRTDRRPGMPVESPWLFYPKYAGEIIRKTWRFGRLYLSYYPVRRRLLRDPASVDYRDIAITPSAGDDAAFEMLNVTEAARAAARRARRRAIKAEQPATAADHADG